MFEILSNHFILIILLATSSVAAGFAAGLFGIGGGAIIVPVLFTLFTAAGYGETAMHTALATSLATITLTSLRSVSAHNKLNAVDWQVLKQWAPWIMCGAVVGQLFAGFLSSRLLTITFSGLAFLLSLQLFLGRPDWKLSDELPSGPARAGLGGGIGILSVLMGIGGGTFGVSLMTLFGRPIKQAVATASGFGAVIGLPSALTAMVAGWSVAELPPFSIGYVNFAAFFLVSTLTVLVAPLGAKAAHTLDPKRLKQAFALLLFAVAAHMASSSL